MHIGIVLTAVSDLVRDIPEYLDLIWHLGL